MFLLHLIIVLEFCLALLASVRSSAKVLSALSLCRHLAQLKPWASPSRPRSPTRGSRCTRRSCTSTGCPRESLCADPTALAPPSYARSWRPQVKSSLSSRGERHLTRSLSKHSQAASHYLCDGCPQAGAADGAGEAGDVFSSRV